jgi:hypothetical protein
MFFVRCDAAARNTSGALECEYSSRKWCSTSHTCSMPILSAILDLFERVLNELVLGVFGPRSRQLVLVEDAEPHAATSAPSCVKAFEDRRTPRVSLERVFDLTHRLLQERVAVRAERLLEGHVPERADHFGSGDAPPDSPTKVRSRISVSAVRR